MKFLPGGRGGGEEPVHSLAKLHKFNFDKLEGHESDGKKRKVLADLKFVKNDKCVILKIDSIHLSKTCTDIINVCMNLYGHFHSFQYVFCFIQYTVSSSLEKIQATQRYRNLRHDNFFFFVFLA